MVSIPNSKFPNAFRSPGGLITARGNSHLRVCPLWISLQVMHNLSDISNLENMKNIKMQLYLIYNSHLSIMSLPNYIFVFKRIDAVLDLIPAFCI